MRDLEHRVWWVLDAKNAKPSRDNQRKMKLQLEAAAAQAWIPTGFTARGLIVHPTSKRQSLLTDDDRMLRTTLAQLELLLTTNALDF